MPMFVLMFLGYALKRLRLISPEMIPKLNKLNFYVFLSVLSFKNVY